LTWEDATPTMNPMSSVTWPCPNCGRRVPNRISQCHCGTTREDALRQAEAGAAVSPPGALRPARRGTGIRIGPLTWDLKALLIGLVLVALLGIVRLFWPSQPERIVPVLGHVDATPKPLPTPTPKAKGWKLPWR
jgi:hypothetical protein